LLYLALCHPAQCSPLPSASAVAETSPSVGEQVRNHCSHNTSVKEKAESALSKGNNTKMSSRENSNLPEDTLNATINAPAAHVWQVLSNFSNYPQIFERVQSVSVTKKDGDLVYIESHLKPHFLIRNEVQHTVNDLSGKPDTLRWQLLDGNFKHIDGTWQIKPASDHSCKVAYTLKVDPGPLIPVKMVSMLLHFVEKEVIASLKTYAEKTYAPVNNHALDLSLRP
jgi:ribosome-associated toxin RatA of RatAB toxin-antitoxin module